mmetsp:Transcript_32123/g.39841  ORF Transcript_32123/g.39841 Transcript_32123/m.39841 type:complete len:171 (-) Transcript_32123:319-831(-)
MAHNSSICIGFVVVFGLGAVLPDPNDIEANEKDEMWRVIWLGPAVIGFIEIALTLFVMRLEPISYCMMVGRGEECRQHLRKVYRKKSPDSSETVEQVMESQFNSLVRSTTLDASSTTFKDAVGGRKYRKGTRVCFFSTCSISKQESMQSMSTQIACSSKCKNRVAATTFL